MNTILKFIFVVFLCLSIFLVVESLNFGPCNTHEDCQKYEYTYSCVMECVESVCDCWSNEIVDFIFPRN
ncbi:putative Late nodulin [Medicago truncatula]|uniref:Nodule Cysteine-Rich (NCR) secreted peptide n=1 Tax=Medicago truncatula TaxID=3880 RepID=A0A072VK98_MEDTR|nr:Nodule Cysteine-Rich (NCR) secreted peptide [Medicago truncatula]RHN74863.1 putative Late nodulin [Medicago truncatula]